MDPLFVGVGALRPVCVPAALACRLIYMLKSYVKFPCSPFLKQEMKSESGGRKPSDRHRARPQQDVVEAQAAQASVEALAAQPEVEAQAAQAGHEALALEKAQPRALPSGSSSTPKSLSASVRSIVVICCSPPSHELAGVGAGPRGPDEGAGLAGPAPSPRHGALGARRTGRRGLYPGGEATVTANIWWRLTPSESSRWRTAEVEKPAKTVPASPRAMERRCRE